MVLADQTDVETRLGRELTDSEQDRLQGLLEEASLLVQGYLGVTYTDSDEIPDAVSVVVSKMVARALIAPQFEGMSHQLTAGPFSMSVNNATNVWLSKADKLMLRNLGGGFASVQLESERY